MKKASVILIISLMTIVMGSAPSDAHEGKAHMASVKGAVRELHEAKEILGKITPDAGGHIVNAAHAVDQALQELSAVTAPAPAPAKS